ncbi:hypothetical protein GQ53DRAFT_364551 [Thozetella sp. PMI_491]|nr:hypothetical protein GQ53DRAFT_364551 [Thozetella sp. PMI_491]
MPRCTLSLERGESRTSPVSGGFRQQPLPVDEKCLIGTVLSDSIRSFRIERLKLKGEDGQLDIWEVSDLKSTYCAPYEAKIIDTPGGENGSRRTDRRKVKRICRSSNYCCEIRQHDKRFLISQVSRSNAELENLQSKHKRRVQTVESLWPQLSSRMKDGARSYKNESTFRPRQFQIDQSVQDSKSYAEVARAGLQSPQISSEQIERGCR